MAHLYRLTGSLPTDPAYLSITTDDAGVIDDMALPPYRSGDQVIKSLVANWLQYTANLVGSPAPVQDITLFREYILDTYGQMYMVRDVW